MSNYSRRTFLKTTIVVGTTGIAYGEKLCFDKLDMCNNTTPFSPTLNLRIDQDICDGCGLCVDLCPMVKISINVNSVACFDFDDICVCYFWPGYPVCQGSCPLGAIT
jgi:ferredoxin